MPPDEDSTQRTWVHPSELGMHSRTRTDRRRGVWLSVGLVLGGIGLLVVGVAMGVGSSEPGAHRRSVMSAIEASVAQVTVVHGDDRHAATGVVLDDGHVAVRADAISGADEVWVTCPGRDARRATAIASDPRAGLSIMTVEDTDGHAVIDTRAPAPGDTVIVARAGHGEAPPTVEHARVETIDATTTVHDSGTAAGATDDVAGSGTAVVRVRIGAFDRSPDASGTSSTVRVVSTTADPVGAAAASTDPPAGVDGAAFDPQGRFVGLIVRDDGTQRELLSATTVVHLAAVLAR